MAIKYQAYETEKVEFLGRYFNIRPLTKSQMRREAELDEKFEDLENRRRDSSEPEVLDELIAAMAERLDARCDPAPDEKDPKPLSEMFTEAWESDEHDYTKLQAFYNEVLGVDPFGL